ncbi:MAG: hypothetical protein U5R48_02645 [Gammaproteobacteria bacterium]|nr:hypothetical protein [Gammaproteobacteria bacterium]
MLEQLTDAAWELPFTLRVDSPLNHPHSRADGDLVEIGPLVEDAAALDPQDRARSHGSPGPRRSWRDAWWSGTVLMSPWP